MTRSQSDALKWLTARGGDGVFDRHGVLLASGESAPFMRSTWNALRDLGKIEFYNPAGKGRGRCKVAKQTITTKSVPAPNDAPNPASFPDLSLHEIKKLRAKSYY